MALPGQCHCQRPVTAKKARITGATHEAQKPHANSSIRTLACLLKSAIKAVVAKDFSAPQAMPVTNDHRLARRPARQS
ncbi:hypothetical protein [Xanthomonas euvesicatoria]|uniref:hypothetical protein n=1 Tax=Xanthomonas euvesicatoria TaxID=456327 RepID=UPI000B11EEA7|nr:hypothetical protein [Xanthomonas euvesicatoria]